MHRTVHRAGGVKPPRAGTLRHSASQTRSHISTHSSLPLQPGPHSEALQPTSSLGAAVSHQAFSGVSRRIVERMRREARLCPPLQAAVQTPPAPQGVADIAAGAAMKVVNVELGDRSYPIYIGRGLLDQAELLQRHVPGSRVLIVTNETIAPLYLERCQAAFSAGGSLQVSSVVLPDGEQYKSMDVVSKVWDAALGARLDRQTTFVALGGGVIGDMTGFAAACYQRGVHFLQIPTTVMAQVDSSVGGKTGVNHPLGKNMIGAFYQPQAVIIDTDTLNTLPDRELASGLSEVIKYGLIRDPALFEWLEANMDRLLARDADAMAYAVEASCLNKALVVAADEKEGGLRATLNLGHTFGHAIETGLGYGAWLHGEAVSAGMVMAADMSVRLGWVEPDVLVRTRALLSRAGLPVAPPEGMDSEAFLELMAVDKKALAGRLRLILLRGPLGSCCFTGEFDPAALGETLLAFCH